RLAAERRDEVAAVDALHGEKPEVLVARELEQRDEVRVRNLGDVAELPLEAQEVRRAQMVQRLQRDARAVLAIDGVVDRPHAAGANEPRDVVATDAYGLF